MTTPRPTKRPDGTTREALTIPDDRLRMALAGAEDQNLRVVSRALGMSVVHQGQDIVVRGEGREAQRGLAVLQKLLSLVKGGYTLYPTDVERALGILSQNADTDLRSIFMDTIYVGVKGRPVAPKGPGQKAYVDSIRSRDITFGVGPAGTGKTYLAMAAAVASLARRKVSRIVLTRPAVEAGERLGFLPGDLEAKVNPYLRPLYDALNDLMGFEESAVLVQKGVIEVAPLAFMRGRTLNDSFVILDEAQNTTPEQMKMFLTRLGFGSQAVVTGDITQTDLPSHKQSGLGEALRILRTVPEVGICMLTEQDIVRHPVVQAIVRAYEAEEVRRKTQEPTEPETP
ncbi:MAG: PhoH family protein [Myxococcota bacterium]